MSGCQRLPAYMNRALGEEKAAQFEVHLQDCVRCRREIDNWDQVRESLISGFDVVPERPSEEFARRLVAEATGERRFAGQRVLIAAIAACVTLAVVGFLFLNSTDGNLEDEFVKPGASQVSVESDREAEGATMAGRVLTAGPAEGLRTRINNDVLTLASSSSLQIDKAEADATWTRLQYGSVTCAVSKRGKGEDFVVEAGAVTVRVVGTQFTVSRNAKEVRVVVAEGRVVVSAPRAESVLLSANESLRFHEAHPERGLRMDPANEDVAAVATGRDNVSEINTASEMGAVPDGGGKNDDADKDHGPSLDELQDWVIDGRIADAESGLVAYLARYGDDMDAWFLLADCRRKAANAAGSLAALETVIEIAPVARAQKAKFMSGVLLQDHLGDNARAASMYEAYLAGGQAKLRAAAMVRLARAYKATGNNQQAGQLLEEVVEKHADTPMAKKASEMLEEME